MKNTSGPAMDFMAALATFGDFAFVMKAWGDSARGLVASGGNSGVGFRSGEGGRGGATSRPSLCRRRPRYETKAEASAEALRGMVPFTRYYCELCDGWHLRKGRGKGKGGR